MANKLFYAAVLAAAASGALVPASQAQENPWQVKVRALIVEPDESATIGVVGGDVRIDTAVVPEIDIGYYFTENISAELVLAVSPHDISAVGTAAGDFPVGNTTLLPPSLTLQYHVPVSEAFKPYVGAGLNYTWFLDKDHEGDVVNSVRLKDSLGYVVQTGVDYYFRDNFFLSLDAKKIWLDTKAQLGTIAGPVEADVNINPWTFSIGFGVRF